MSNENSIRPDGGTSLLGLCEVRPEAQASRMGKSLAVAGGTGQRDNERVLKETVSERKAATSPEGGWRQNSRKCKRGKQGNLSGFAKAFGFRGGAGTRCFSRQPSRVLIVWVSPLKVKPPLQGSVGIFRRPPRHPGLLVELRVGGSVWLKRSSTEWASHKQTSGKCASLAPAALPCPIGKVCRAQWQRGGRA